MTVEATERETKAYVLDASVAVKLFSDEEGSVSARSLFAAGEKRELILIAPDLLLYEVANALGKGKKLLAEQVAERLMFLMNSSIEFVSLDARAIHWGSVFAQKYDLTFYDAVYAGLAHIRGVPLVSANPRDHRKVKEIAVQNLESQ